MVARMDHYLPLDRGAHLWGMSMPNAENLPRKSVEEYVKSGRIFIAAEADDKLLHNLSSSSARIKFCFHRISPRRGPGKCGAGNS